MRFLFVAFAVIISALAMQTEPDEYPDGQYCTPKGTVVGHLTTSDHPCHCSRMYVNEADGSPSKTCAENDPASHDPRCMQWCHEDHCGCPIACSPTSQ